MTTREKLPLLYISTPYSVQRRHIRFCYSVIYYFCADKLTTDSYVNLQTDYKVAYSFIGGPRASSVESLAKATAAAKKMANSQKSRHPSSLSKRKTVELLVDPDMRESDEEVEGLELWKLLPQLKDIPEHLLKKMPLSAVFMLNNALAKEQKTSERLGVNTRLPHNAKK